MTGTKIPLIKIKGNLIRVESIIAFEGLSVGIEEIISPSDEKQNAAIKLAASIGMLIINSPKNNELTMKITVVISVP